jgi:hypothetical protein
MFGAGALFGVVAGGVLYAPPEVANQPAPWELWARGRVDAVATPAQAPVAQAPAAVAEPAPPVIAEIAAPPQAAASSAEATKVAVASRPAPARKKPRVEEPAVDTTASGAGPAPEPVRVQPEPIRVQPEPPAQAEGQALSGDPSR